MAIITGKQNVLDIYTEAGEKGWVLPCFCSENLTTTEAVLEAASQYGEATGIANLPIMIAITCRYEHRSQSACYTHTRRWDTGLRLFCKDIEVLAGNGGPFEKLRVLVHLDHIQHDKDKHLLEWDLSMFSSIMYDASMLPFPLNMEHTARFVNERGSFLVVEGACDEIVDAEGSMKSELTTPDKAEEYHKTTGVDMIVANLGTEHRASSKSLNYYSDNARKIKERIGAKIVLHGASSVSREQIAHLYEDGICKVNIWTILERDSTPVLFRKMMENASKVAGRELTVQMQNEGLLGDECIVTDKASLDYFTTMFRQDIIFHEMKSIIKGYLSMWYV